jgi:hypothetical protein
MFSDIHKCSETFSGDHAFAKCENELTALAQRRYRAAAEIAQRVGFSLRQRGRAGGARSIVKNEPTKPRAGCDCGQSH